MKVAVIGRTEVLYETALRVRAEGHEIACIVTAKEAPEYLRSAADFEDLARDWGIAFASGPRIAQYVDLLRGVGADIAVSMNYVGIIPHEVIDIFPLGVLNAHGGDLPRYRGNACQAWAIINGEPRIGLCIHKMVGGELDSGDIIARDYLEIDHTTTITDTWSWLSERTPALMCEAVRILEGTPDYVLERQSVDPADVLRCYPRRPEDGRIDWDRPAIEVLRLVNASTRPYAGAFCEFEGQRMIIWRAELLDDAEHFCAVPGQVTSLTEGCVDVACGSGKLRLVVGEIAGESGSPQRWISSLRSRLS